MATYRALGDTRDPEMRTSGSVSEWEVNVNCERDGGRYRRCP